MSATAHSTRWTAWERIACVIVPALLAAGLSLPRMFGERWMADTPYYQAISLHMPRQGSWWTMHEGMIEYFNKPPLAFWAHGLSVRIFGEADWAYHLPEMIWFVLTCAVVASLARRLWNARIGVCAGAAMALTDDWYWRVPNFRLEFLLALLLIAALRCWAEALAIPGEERPTPNVSIRSRVCWAIGAGACIGLGLLVKPLIALGLIPLAIAWLGILRRLDRRSMGLILLSGIAGALVALPWHLSMVVQHGRAFTDAYFVNQSYKRATGQMFDPEPWWWYFRYITDKTRDLKPYHMWVVYGLALAGLALIAARRFPAPKRAGDVLAVLYTIGWLAALCAFADKRNYYLLVIHPGTALLAGRFIGSVTPVLFVRWTSVVAAGVGLVLLARGAAGIPQIRASIPLPAERAALMGFVQSHPDETYYNGGLVYQDAALVYISTRVWPRTLVEKAPVERSSIPVGAWIVYSRGGLERTERHVVIDPGDEVLFHAKGDPPRPGVPGREYIVVRRR